MILLTEFPAFSTICINALEQFEAVGNCKGSVFHTLDCYQSPGTDGRDEEVHVEDQANSRAFQDELLRHDDTADTLSLSSYLHPKVPTSMQHHNRNDSTTTALSLDDEIFRSRRVSLPSDSLLFTLCKLHRCTAFSQDSVDRSQHLNSDTNRCDPPVEVVYWDELVKDPEVMGII
jgi:hypothetical protein